jgi:hypothetical protein
MGMLRDRMICDLKLRRCSVETQRAYLSCVRQLAKYFRRSPDKLSEEKVRQFLRHLVEERRLCSIGFSAAISSLAGRGGVSLMSETSLSDNVRSVYYVE